MLELSLVVVRIAVVSLVAASGFSSCSSETLELVLSNFGVQAVASKHVVFKIINVPKWQ